MLALALVLSPAVDLVGQWQAWGVIEGLPAYKHDWTLTFRRDRTFTERMRNRTMMTLDIDTTGTYSFDGAKAILKGTSHYRMDDGYKKDSGKKEMTYVFLYRKGELVFTGGREMIFRRVGAGAPTVPPKPKLGVPSPEVANIVKEVERRYAAFKTYADKGTLVTNGDGGRPKEARVSTRFIRPGKFLFELQTIKNWKVFNRSAAWSDGKKSWSSVDLTGARANEEHSARRALGTMQIGAASLIPPLLMPSPSGKGALSRYPHVLRVRDKRSGGAECFVLEFSMGSSSEVTLWIDKTNYLIRRSSYSFANEQTDFEPRVNAALKPSDLIPVGSQASRPTQPR